MGRVRRYKKLKACDPFAGTSKSIPLITGKKIKNGNDMDLPPSDDDDDDNDDEREQHKEEEKVKQKEKRERQQLKRWEKEFMKNSSLTIRNPSGIMVQEKEKTLQERKIHIEGKQENESMKKFNKRIREETSKILAEEVKAFSTTKKRKMEHLKKRKEIKKIAKRKKINKNNNDYDNGEEETITYGTKEFQERVNGANNNRIRQWGETNDRPPQFSVLPKRKRTNADILKEALAKKGLSTTNTGSSNNNNNDNKSNNNDSVEVLKAKKRQFEMMRERVQNAYKLNKQNRNNNGGESGSYL